MIEMKKRCLNKSLSDVIMQLNRSCDFFLVFFFFSFLNTKRKHKVRMQSWSKYHGSYMPQQDACRIDN